jgi:ribosomal protein L7/L12
MIISKELEAKIQALLLQNRKIEAIKLVVDTTRCGLKEAKDLVDNYAAGGKPAGPVSYQHIDEELMSLLLKGEKLQAVKRYKEVTGLGLAESKDYVDNLMEKGASSQGNRSSRNRETQIDDIIKEQGSKPKSGCFIATACYGDYNATEVLVLRKFRDEQLLRSFSGKVFVRFYYTVSPLIAKQLEKSAKLKRLIITYLLNPMVTRLSGRIRK